MPAAISNIIATTYETSKGDHNEFYYKQKWSNHGTCDLSTDPPIISKLYNDRILFSRLEMPIACLSINYEDMYCLYILMMSPYCYN